MEVTLIARFFNEYGAFYKLTYDGLVANNINVNCISQEDCLIKNYNKLAYLFFTSIDLKRLINKKEYSNSDVFHALSPLESFYLPKQKSVATILDFFPLNDTNTFISSNTAKLFNKSIESAISCERIIALNSSIKDRLNQEYGVELDKIEVITPSIDSKYTPTNKTKDNDTFVIGTVSVLMKRKRVDLLIKAFLEADIENSKLLIGGKGTEMDYLKELAGGDERIKFLGFIPDESMNDFYNSLDVFVFPTLVEGYGMPMVEAMGCGKPIITLSDAEIPEEIKEKTFVTTVEDLPNVLKNRTFKCNIKKNIEFYKEHSVQNRIEKLLKVYESI